MLKRTLIILSVAGALYGCDSRKKEEASLRATVDSLRLELKDRNNAAEMIQDISVLMDSIDAYRKVLHVKMGEGTSMNDFRARMGEIAQYVKETQTKITQLDAKVTASNSAYAGFAGTIKKLKHDLEVRNQELASMQEQVARYHNQQENLVQTVDLQKAELTDKLAQLETKQEEVKKLEDRVNELLTQSKENEGEAYFLRAQALEETANRTKFAPRKKKTTRKQALELYKLAVDYGKVEAQEKVAELEKQI